MKPTRRKTRELVLQALYAREVGKHEPLKVIQDQLQPELKSDAELLEFGRRLVEQTILHEAETDPLIEKHTQNWKLERIALIDRLILRMAVTEFIHFEDIPEKVSLNEAIEIAKDFSTPKSGTFINGILDAILSELKESNQIQKKGRGLLNTSS
jgi:N utilization substance protein B